MISHNNVGVGDATTMLGKAERLVWGSQWGLWGKQEKVKQAENG